MATKNDSSREGDTDRQRNGSWQGVGKFKEDELELSAFSGRSACQVSEEATECMHMAYHPDKEDPLDR